MKMTNKMALLDRLVECWICKKQLFTLQAKFPCMCRQELLPQHPPTEGIQYKELSCHDVWLCSEKCHNEASGGKAIELHDMWIYDPKNLKPKAIIQKFKPVKIKKVVKVSPKRKIADISEYF